MSEHLRRLARGLEAEPDFLACVLAEHARAERIDEAELAKRLGCDEETLTDLRLCRVPRPAPPMFGDDIDQIADCFKIDADALAAIVRGAASLRALRGEAPSAANFLMAARDNAADPPASEDPA